jgi:hypothetical protein
MGLKRRRNSREIVNKYGRYGGEYWGRLTMKVNLSRNARVAEKLNENR